MSRNDPDYANLDPEQHFINPEKINFGLPDD